jgi:uncharacterized protein (TIGR02996 family)
VSLQRAVESAQKGEVGAALEALVVAWQRAPAQAIGDAIVAVGALADLLEAPLGGKTAAEREENWRARAAENRAAALGPLLATVMETKGSSQTQERLALLLWARDPRLSDLVGKWLQKPPYNGSASRTNQYWKFLFSWLAQLGDPRLLTLARGLPEAWKVAPISDHERAMLNKRLAKVMPEIEAAYATGFAALSTDDEARCREVVALLSKAGQGAAAERAGAKASEAELLAAVYAAPDDDGPRLVYADWLAERGDPRGEFIQLQFKRRDAKLTPPESRREADLIAEHGRKWLGAIEPHVLKSDLAFERGFLSTCAANLFTDHPEWSTVKRLLRGAPVDKRPLPSVESVVTEMIHDGLSLLPRLVELEIERIWPELNWMNGSVAQPEKVLEVWRRQKHAIKRLYIEGHSAWLHPHLGPNELAWIFDGLGRAIVDLELCAPPSQLSAWLACANQRHLERLCVRFDHQTASPLAAEFSRGSDGKLSRLRLTGKPRNKQMWSAHGVTVISGDGAAVHAAVAALALESVEDKTRKST